jgi:dihydroorotase-like cyclic amidohydrolase
VILPQVTFGIAVRMAVMSMLAVLNGMNYQPMNIDRNGRLIDPASGSTRRSDRRRLHRRGQDRRDRRRAGRLQRRSRIDASGCRVPRPDRPAARLREPGFEYRATLESEMQAAMAGGITSLAMPARHRPAARRARPGRDAQVRAQEARHAASIRWAR